MRHHIDNVQTTAGVAVPNASVAVYLTGTNTLATIYSNDSLGAKTNPTLTAADGTYDFYVADGRYDIKTTFGGVTTSKLDVEIVDVTEKSSSDTPLNIYAKNLNNIRFADQFASLQAAISDAGASGCIIIPPGVTLSVDTTTPITVTNNFVSIIGMGRGSSINVTGTGDLFQVSGQDFLLDNINITISSVGARTSAAIINPTASLGKVRNVTVLGSASVNNGSFALHTAAGGTGGQWTYEHIRIIGGTTWKSFITTKASGATIAGTVLDDVIVYATTFSDAGCIFDTLTDTVKMSDCQIVATAGVPVQCRNTGAGQAPRWIHFNNCSIEANNASTALLISDGRDIKYVNGYIASAVNAASVAGGAGIDISHNLFTNIQQHGVLVAAAASNVKLAYNDFDDAASLQTNNTYDCINVAASTGDFMLVGNQFRAPSSNKPRYAINLGASTGFFVIADNDTTAVAWGTSAFLNSSTSLVQRIWNNAGIPDFNKESAGVPVFPNGLNTSGSGLILSGATSGSTTIVPPAIASGTATLPANTGVIAELNLSQSWSADQTFTTQTITQSANGGQWVRGQASELLTLSTSGTTTDTSANLLPANSIIEALVARVTTTITTATDWKLGDSTIAGRFSSANSTMTAGTTQVGTVQVDQTGTSGPRQVSAAKVRVTTTGTPGAGAIRITVFYRAFTAPTS